MPEPYGPSGLATRGSAGMLAPPRRVPGSRPLQDPPMHDPQADSDLLTINTIRFLAVDMVEAAQSGHPGTPMALAPMGHLLFSRYLRFDPRAPGWPNRDRFVLSCGHASALLYALLHLAG